MRRSVGVRSSWHSGLIMRAYGPPAGLHFVTFYPVEGDTAIAELVDGGEMWGDVQLEGIRLSEPGDARISQVNVRIRLLPPPNDRRSWDFDLSDVESLLAEARGWLLDNERGRLPEPE
jgi:hypothetical protein